ncbi:vesicle-associated membrane protein 8-like [Seriola dumerili]|uniref:vesicle-associated membrane protein 8-like n=1 Tax=Seriola dumerili TaxID=41447 RepID=UPI000BBF3AD1|nr:vesicle-associated membrane protein 8-like [Seriola dumerili]
MEQEGMAAEPAPQNKMQDFKDQINVVTDQMKENMKKIIEKNEKVVNLVTRSEEMEEGAKHFKYKSQKVSCSYWWKNVKLNVVVVVVVLLIILLLIIILLATGVIPTKVTETSKP